MALAISTKIISSYDQIPTDRSIDLGHHICHVVVLFPIDDGALT
tara:strand:+ start:29677 stop:29808 length:132 start_codon:yes stop_codon:yes gene_type:complete